MANLNFPLKSEHLYFLYSHRQYFPTSIIISKQKILPPESTMPKLSLISLLTILTILTTCPTLTHTADIKTMTGQKLRDWTYIFDDIHRFIIVDQNLRTQLQPILPVRPDTEYYTHDCTKNNTLLIACQQNRNIPILVIYNKIPIEFDIWMQGLTSEKLKQDVLEWMDRIVNGHSRKDLSQEEINGILEKQGDVFILVENKTIHQLGMGYNILAKQFPFQDFVYLTKPQQYEKLGLTPGNFLHIKNLNKNPQTPLYLPMLIKDLAATSVYPKQLALRYDHLKVFVLQNIFTRGFSKNIDNLQQQRFDLKIRKQNSKGQYQPKRDIVVFCDLTLDCIRFWQKLELELFVNGGNSESREFKKIIKRFDLLRNIQLLQVFFHIRLRDKKLPFVFVIDGEDPSVPYLPLRYAKQLSLNSKSPYEEIEQFLKQIDERKLPNTELSSGIPKKNGFTGKGSEKSVQKLSYQTYKKILKQHKSSNKFYLLFVTAFEFQCPQCLEFYNEYKKLASFLSASDRTDITLGVYDLSKDQIDLKYIKNIPSVFLFTPYQETPVEYRNRYDFESVHKFINKQIEKAKANQAQRTKKIQIQETKNQEQPEQSIQL